MGYAGRYAVVIVLCIPAIVAMNVGGGWAVAGFVWLLLMRGLYQDWVAKD